jgi:hypothetical protein
MKGEELFKVLNTEGKTGLKSSDVLIFGMVLHHYYHDAVIWCIRKLGELNVLF